MILDAENRAETLKKEKILEAKEEAHKHRSDAEREIRERRNEIQKSERRLIQKEEAIDRKLENIEKKEESITNKERSITSKQQEMENLLKRQMEELEKISGYSTAVSYTHLRYGDAIGNLSIGQGETLVTPLQVARMTNVIASGGIDKGVHILMEEESSDGQVLSSETADAVSSMMESVTESGTGKNLELIGEDGIPKAALKTGTAEYSDEDRCV